MLEITRQEMPLRGLPEPLHGATVVHLSDFHGGFGNTDAVYEEAIRQTNEADPDLVLLTGDYIDDYKAIKDYPIQDTLRRFRARMGVYGSFGNHDHRRGVVGTRSKLEQAGVHVLHNENIHIAEGLWLAGLDDIHEGKPDIEATFAGIPGHVTPIVLSHNPRLIERIPTRYAQILSGHTHGAQICLSFPTPKMICVGHLRCRQVAGWYTNKSARLYVNRGLGVTGKPFRHNCPAEVAIFRLVPDPQEGHHRRVELEQRRHERETADV
jgi:predicted MPP superfamily phosphohydrolase